MYFIHNVNSSSYLFPLGLITECPHQATIPYGPKKIGWNTCGDDETERNGWFDTVNISRQKLIAVTNTETNPKASAIIVF